MPRHPDDDAVLAERARQGDRGALEQLLRRHEPRLRVLCRRLCGHDADGDDALQEALVAVVRGIGRFDGRSTFATWAYRVATNASLDELRRRARRPDPVARLPEPDPSPDPAPAAAEQAEDRGRLLAALGALPPEFRAPVVLRDVLDLDYAEIAAVLDLAPGTVRSRIARGRGRLADVLAATEGGAGAAAEPGGGTASAAPGNLPVTPIVQPQDLP